MLPGQMQDRDLAIIDILRFAAQAHPDREIVSRNVDEPIWRYGYRACLARAAQAAGYLTQLGIRPGDVIMSVEGRAVNNVAQLLSAVAALKPGAPATLEVVRKDGKTPVKVTPGKRTAPKAQQQPR